MFEHPAFVFDMMPFQEKYMLGDKVRSADDTLVKLVLARLRNIAGPFFPQMPVISEKHTWVVS